MDDIVKPQARGTVKVVGLRLFARHGVADIEQKVGNEFEIDIDLNFPAAKAMNTDNLEQTINYAEVVEIARQCMLEPCKLLEHAVALIFSALTDRFPFVDHGRIALYKLQPPIAGQLSKVGFVYSW